MPLPSAYNPNVPQATDQLSTSQNDLLNNFGAIQSLVDVDHVDFAAAGAGKHKQVTFPVQGAAPAFAAGEIGLYNLLPIASPITGVDELYINKQNSGAAVQIPMTASILSTNGTPGNAVAGWTYLPSGILLKWGNGTATGSTNFAFPVAANIPVFSGVMTMLVSTAYNNVADGDGFARLSTWTTTTFQVYGSQRTQTNAQAVSFQYLAIGY